MVFDLLRQQIHEALARELLTKSLAFLNKRSMLFLLWPQSAILCSLLMIVKLFSTLSINPELSYVLSEETWEQGSTEVSNTC